MLKTLIVTITTEVLSVIHTLYPTNFILNKKQNSINKTRIRFNDHIELYLLTKFKID